MKSRAFTYNPTENPVSGTFLHGDLLIEDDSQDYSSKPGNLTWWQGPDEDLGYVIATSVPASNRPTPVGNIGSVRFWRTKTFSDLEFVNLANLVTGQSFVDANSAEAWLNSGSVSYWTSFGSTNFSLISQYEARNSASYPPPYSSSTWFDLSATNNDITLVGATYDSETFQMYFNNAYASIGQVVTSNSSYSILAWINPFTVSGAHNILSSENSPFWINAGTLYAGVGGNYTEVSHVGISDGTYYFVAVTFDDAANTMTLYVDGTQVDQNTNVTASHTAENMYIGSHYSAGINVSFFEGFINYVAVYNGVMSSAGILSTYNSTVATYGS